MTPEQAAKLQHMFDTCNQVYVETNPHHVTRETVSTFLRNDPDMAEDFVGQPSDGVVLYVLQVYPHTPTSFFRSCGHDLGVLIDGMAEVLR